MKKLQQNLEMLRDNLEKSEQRKIDNVATREQLSYEALLGDDDKARDSLRTANETALSIELDITNYTSAIKTCEQKIIEAERQTVISAANDRVDNAVAQHALGMAQIEIIKQAQQALKDATAELIAIGRNVTTNSSTISPQYAMAVYKHDADRVCGLFPLFINDFINHQVNHYQATKKNVKATQKTRQNIVKETCDHLASKAPVYSDEAIANSINHLEKELKTLLKSDYAARKVITDKIDALKNGHRNQNETVAELIPETEEIATPTPKRPVPEKAPSTPVSLDEDDLSILESLNLKGS